MQDVQGLDKGWDRVKYLRDASCRFGGKSAFLSGASRLVVHAWSRGRVRARLNIFCEIKDNKKCNLVLHHCT